MNGFSSKRENKIYWFNKIYPLNILDGCPTKKPLHRMRKGFFVIKSFHLDYTPSSFVDWIIDYQLALEN